MTILNKKDYARFGKLIEDGLKHPVGLVPTPRLNHDDLIKRINDEAMKAGMPPDIADKFLDYDINERRKDLDRRSGDYEIKATISTKTIKRFFKQLFGGKKKWPG